MSQSVYICGTFRGMGEVIHWDFDFDSLVRLYLANPRRKKSYTSIRAFLKKTYADVGWELDPEFLHELVVDMHKHITDLYRRSCG